MQTGAGVGHEKKSIARQSVPTPVSIIIIECLGLLKAFRKRLMKIIYFRKNNE